MEELFRCLKLDDDTRLLKPRKFQYLGEFPMAMEIWFSEGVKGESAIFRSADVASLSDAELESLVRNEMNVKGQVTMTRCGEFAFVNHSFETL